jgi:hypothetical protein
MEALLENDDSAKGRVQELVTAMAEAQGIDPKQLVFKWASEPLVLQEHLLELKEKVFNLRIYLGKKSQVLSFAESVIQNSVTSPKTFLAAYTDQLIAALKRLKRFSAAAGGKS